MKYVEKYGYSEEKAKEFFVNHMDISCEMCNTKCTWRDVNISVEGLYVCDDCMLEEEEA